jgi:hypothetical protein
MACQNGNSYRYGALIVLRIRVSVLLLATLVVARFSGQSPDNPGSITVGPKNHTLKISHVFFQKMPIFWAFPAYFLGISVENLPSHILRSLVPNYI